MVKIRSCICLFISIHLLGCFCLASDVAYISKSSTGTYEESSIEIACNYYGLKIEQISVPIQKSAEEFAKYIQQENIRAIIVSAPSLAALKNTEQLLILRALHETELPILIFGIYSNIGMNILSEWSKEAIKKCSTLNKSGPNCFYQVANLKTISKQLAGIKIPLIFGNICYFLLSGNKNVESIIQVSDEKNNVDSPIFIKTLNDGQDVFWLARNQLTRTRGKRVRNRAKDIIMSKQENKDNDNDVLQILPFMMFLQYVFKEKCWHSHYHYANLTIDDPWLVEPYGFLSYRGLLEQMQKYNFSTTIAFIPWNFDRSKPDVVKLFKDNPGRFSICIHGNNHDHQEFYKDEYQRAGPWQAKPLSLHEMNIKQALARMEEFRRLTGLSYDKVMIFPHEIASAETLAILKRYNFLATVNAENLPPGSEELSDKIYQLRNITLNYGNFPSLKRYSPDKTYFEIALDLFLDNPLLFYAHSDYFRKGIDAFDDVAQVINSIQPDIIWQGLGYIVQHFYLERLRDDGNYDVIAFADSFVLENRHQNKVTYFVKKEESFSVPIKQVTVDDKPCLYSKSANSLQLEISVPAAESRYINIEYENILDFPSIDISKKSQRVNRLRRLSDFRDMKLSKNFMGRTITYVYYNTGVYKVGLFRLALISIIIAILICLGLWYLVILRKRKAVLPKNQ